MTRMQELKSLGQSVWLDYIERSMIETGELRQLVRDGLGGVTSNPTIFQQAISKSTAYNEQLTQLARRHTDAKTIFEELAIADIQAATAVLRPVYDEAGGHDGFVSLEVAPDLAYDTTATVAEARRLHAAVNRSNLMVKVPATKAGLPAIRQLLAQGININVTLIFSLERYAEVKEAYMLGLEDRLAAGLPIDKIASVASFFVSRVDVAVDQRLEKVAKEQPAKAATAKSLLGKAAVANSKLAYAQFAEKFSGSRWERLAAAGARVQRPLWASTGAKNPAYSDLIYVDNLIGPHTVNTMPPQTIVALQDHGVIERTVDKDLDQAAADLMQLPGLGILLAQVTDELETDGVKKFADSFTQLLGAIDQRRAELATA